jgi:hypothetical protein
MMMYSKVLFPFLPPADGPEENFPVETLLRMEKAGAIAPDPLSNRRGYDVSAGGRQGAGDGA